MDQWPPIELNTVHEYSLVVWIDGPFIDLSTVHRILSVVQCRSMAHHLSCVQFIEHSHKLSTVH